MYPPLPQWWQVGTNLDIGCLLRGGLVLDLGISSQGIFLSKEGRTNTILPLVTGGICEVDGMEDPTDLKPNPPLSL